ncbi:ABC transporter substrate-binding protein [Dinoroseobacter sp. S76]|uniref:ABC transporter substrate-binding protein n=1 Tax=Dinoroseobacter sp. S76 TaxID=3415124 RepID=UPI003C7A1680
MPTGFSRRHALKTGAAFALATPAYLRSTSGAHAATTLKLGLVSPQTGPLASFGEADQYVIDAVRKAVAGGIETPEGLVNIEIAVRDTQSNPNRAAEVAADLLLDEEVSILLAASTPDTTNPAADQAELNGTPCITTDTPWQAHFFGRNGDPAVGFDYTYHFFWGLEGVVGAFLDMWRSSGAAPVVGGLFPNDPDGNAWADPVNGFPAPLAEAGFALVDGGRFQPLNDDFSAQISAFKQAGVEIVTGVMIPPDFATFWQQAAQQEFRPKVVTVGKALLFPSVIDSLGARGMGLTTEVWWSPSHPYRSGLTGQTAQALAAEYMAATGRPWTQPLGFKHALFEVAIDAIKRAETLDPEAIRDAIAATRYQSVVGPVDWSRGPVKNVSTTDLVAGQWQTGTDLVITNNGTSPHIPVGGPLQLIG